MIQEQDPLIILRVYYIAPQYKGSLSLSVYSAIISETITAGVYMVEGERRERLTDMRTAEALPINISPLE